MRLDMPSSMRPTTTSVGIDVVKPRKSIVAMPKQKAMGTPIARHRTPPNTRNRTMLALPSVSKTGDRNQRPPRMAATRMSEPTASARRAVRTSSATTRTPIRSMPTGRASAR